MQVGLVLLQVDDGIADELSRPVVGHVAAALDLGHLQAAPPKLGGVERQTRGSSAPAQRHHRIVLDQQQQVLGQLPAHAQPAERPLQLERLGVGLAAEIRDAEAAAHAGSPARRAPAGQEQRD